MEIARFDFVRKGLAIRRGHFQIEARGSDD
jgi:hypothetical protein